MAAPYSLMATSNEASGYGTCSASPWMSVMSTPCSAASRRAVASWRLELSMPTTRAPRRAIHADT
jgi:hypothetical protein